MSLVVYKSSAGSGKTTTLVNEYLSLALKNPDYFGSIIALTFTIKATSEMKERVFKVLDKIIHLEENRNDAGLINGLNHIKRATGFDETKIRSQSKILLHNILHQYSDFAFSTIDSFVVRIVRSFAHDLNLPMDFNIELDTELLIEQAIAMLFDKIGENQELTNFLIQYILQNVDNEKTLKIENDLAELGKIIFDSRHYQSIEKLDSMDLGVFSAVNKKLKRDLKKFESRAANIAQETLSLIHKNDIEYSSFSRGTLPKQLNNILKGKIDTEHNIFKNAEDNKLYPNKANKVEKEKIDSIREQLVSLFESMKTLFDSEAKDYHNKRLILEKLNPLALLTEIKLLLNQYSNENNVIHLSESNKKITDIVLNEHIPFIYERVGRKYNHYLVDEFQDTSVIQWNNLLPLIDNSLSSNHFNMLVGDAKQSIYRWRDGDVDQFINLPHIKGSEENPILKERENNLRNHIQEENLHFNYRSELNVIEFNNLFFKYLLERPLNKKDSVCYLDSERINKVYSDYSQTAGKTNDNGKVIIHNTPKDSEITYEETIVTHIHELLNQNYRLQDIAILARTRKILHRMADILVQNEINIVSSETLYIINNAPVRLLISIIQYVGMQDRKNNLLNIVHILSQEHNEKGTKILHNIKTYIDQIGKNDDFALLVTVLAKMGYQISKEKIQSLQTYDLTEYLISIFKLNASPNPFVQSLLNNILENAHKNGAGIKAFLDFWESKKDRISISLPENIDAVKLLTIHKAKGLEFPVVIFQANGFTTPRNEIHWIEPKVAEIDLLNVAMVSHKSEMELSSFKNQFLDENDKRNLDNLNMVYVANTRPTEQLIILFEEAKSGSMWDKFTEFKNIEHHKLKVIDDNRFEFGQMSSKHKTEKSIDTNPINQLISSDWERKLRLKKVSNLHLDEDQKLKIEKGKILHYLLSQIGTVDDINPIVQQSYLQGIFGSSEIDYYKSKLEDIISKPSLKDFFRPDNKEINENTIILPNGEQRRPDKVIVRSNETLIIDYKLSNWANISEQDREKHVNQLNEYRELLKLMHYPNVKAHLIYMEGEIQNIEVMGN